MKDDHPTVELEINGARTTVAVHPSTPLMHVLRNDLTFKGVRTGCSIGECGACTVIMDGQAVQSCITPISEAAGSQVTTAEGLGGPEDPHPVQQAFIDEQAAQCGYCVNGMIMRVAATLEANPSPSEDELRSALDEHICRCGTHLRLLRAANRAAGLTNEGVGASGDRTVASDPSDPTPTTTVPQAVQDEPRIERWITAGEDGEVVIHPGKVELGQGIRTEFVQVVASQLGIDTSCVRIAPTTTGASPDQGQTSGSFSTEHGGVALAMAANAFRRALAERAASRLGTSADQITFQRDGAATSADGERLSLTELASDGPVTGRIEADDAPRWDAPLVGEPLPRDDLRTKLTGAPAYVQDLAPEGMLHARAFLPPSLHAEPENLNLDAARQLPGVREIVVDGRLVIVIAEREEQAIRAHSRLTGDTRWTSTETLEERDTEVLLRSLPAEEYSVRRDDDVEEVFSSFPGHQASYSRPYQAHGPMAPSAAVAVVRDGVLTVWTQTQGVYPLRRELAALLEMPEERIVLEHADGPGCYGLTAADDAASLAAIAARSVPGEPVRFQFSMSEEFNWEPHGPGMVADLQAAISEDGRIRAWRHRTITDSHSTRPNGDGDRLLAAWLRAGAVERPWVGLGEPGIRNAVPLYEIPSLDVLADHVRGPLRTGPLRSLGSFHNVFASESFMDEVAERAGQDPVAFRLAHLTDERARRVLEVAAEEAGWVEHVGPSGRGQGVALCKYKDSKAYAAIVVDVDLDPESGEFSIERVVLACDAGTVINPDGLRNQLEGGVLQGISRTLHEELQLGPNGIRETDWTSYPVLRFREVPPVEITLIDRPGYPPMGVGESSTPPTPAAIANAIDDHVGIRLRSLPLTPAKLQQRLLDMSEDEMQRVRL